MAVRGHATVVSHDADHAVARRRCAPIRRSRRSSTQLVESLCPAPRYLELFARKTRPGWDTWGDEVPSPSIPSFAMSPTPMSRPVSLMAGRLQRPHRHAPRRTRGADGGAGRCRLGAFASSAVAMPFVLHAQERARRIGILLPAVADDPVWQASVGAFLQALELSGWTIGRKVQIDTRWATTNADDIRRHAVELAALAPDVILATGTATVAPLLQATRVVPIVLCRSSIRSAAVSSRAWNGRAERDWVHDLRIRHEWKMAGTAQRDRAPRDASGGPS